jgi:predicted  nucleic acid-binding Zn-ribbon protein
MGQTLTLYRLQQIDTQIDRVNTRIQIVEKMLADGAALVQGRREAETAGDVLRTANQSVKQAEAETQNLRIKIEQTEASLYSGSVRNPKELQDLQNDLTALKRHLKILEDRQLDFMLGVETAEASEREAQQVYEALKRDSAAQHQNLELELSLHQKDFHRLSMERSAAVAGISNEDIFLYNQLRQQRRGVAVSAVTDGACGACGSSLTPSQIQSARSTSERVYCPACGRILYGN